MRSPFTPLPADEKLAPSSREHTSGLATTPSSIAKELYRCPSIDTSDAMLLPSEGHGSVSRSSATFDICSRRSALFPPDEVTRKTKNNIRLAFLTTVKIILELDESMLFGHCWID